MRDYAKAVSVESLFSEFFFRKYEIPLPGYSAFEQLNRMGKLLLIFDGFDEMAAKVDRQQMINNFWELARVVVPGSKAILTCRTEHFPEAQESRALLRAELKASTANLSGEPPQFEVLELEKLDDLQIQQLLENRAGSDTSKTLMRNPQLLDLARRPVMTEFILEALPDIQAGKPVNLSRIYFYAITRKMERDIESGRTFTSLADKLYFLCEIAWEMLSTDRMSLNYKLFPDHLGNLFGGLVREQKNLDHWHYDMMRNTMLIRNADGDYKPAHRSLLEFFVAYKFAAELGLLAPDFTEAAKQQSNLDPSLKPRDYTWSAYFQREIDETGSVRLIAPMSQFGSEKLPQLSKTFGLIPITPAVLDLIKDMLITEPRVKKDLLKLIKSTADSTKEAGLTGGNAVSLLLHHDSRALSGESLTGVQLNNADLSGADLSGCDLKSASLKKARFRGTVLERADLRKADLTEALFAEVGWVTSVSVSPDGRHYASGYNDGSIRINEMVTGNEILVMRAHKAEVHAISWSPNSDFVASGAEDGSLGTWSFPDGNEVFFHQKAHAHWVIDLLFDRSGEKIFTAGGMEESTVKVWSTKGELLRSFHLVPANQANRMSLSPKGDYLLISYWDRRLDPEGTSNSGFALLRVADKKLSLVKLFERPCWNLCFASDGVTFFAPYSDTKDRETRHIGIYDTETQEVTETVEMAYEPRCVTKDNRLLAAPFWGKKGNSVELWYVGKRKRVRVASLRFGPQARLMDRPSDSFRRSDVCFSVDDNILLGGSDDGAIRFWDARVFITTEGSPHIQMREYNPANNSEVTEDRQTWPAWWQGTNIEVPAGYIPNPDFGKPIRVQEQKVICDGLRLQGAVGLSTVTIEGLQSEVNNKSKAKFIREWFIERGAKV